MSFINQALERGARLVAIDPRRTESSERAELLIQPRPGTDGVIALAIAHLLIESGRLDREFIRNHVKGFSAFAELAARMSPRRAAEVSDVPVEYIERLAALLVERKPVTICAGFGMQRYCNSGQTMRAIIALLAITGNIGRSGAGWQFANLQTSIFDAVQDPIAFYPPETPDGIVRVSVSTARLGRDMIASRNPPLKMIWVERGNPVTQNPETHTVLEAIRSMEFRVVVDQFMTDTAREADIVLPAKSLFEQSDVIGAYWHPYIQLKQKVIDPPGEVKPETEIYRLLAERLRMPAEAIRENIPAEDDIEGWLEARLDGFPELSLERLREGPVLAPGHQEIAFSDFVFPTPSGKIELYSEEAADRWSVSPLPEYTEPVESANTSGVPPKYPLYFMTPNTKNRIHSQFNNLEMIRAVSGGPRASMNPSDAGERSIRHGDWVRIINDRGEIRVRVQLDFSLKAGCVSVTNGWWIQEGGTVNYCSLGRETDMGHGAAFHENLVEVVRDG
jgi:anaerobic selenocysteine-containing dehydrogenase